jgi:hypothetical protein
MTTFDRLIEPVLPILQEIEQGRVPHFNETHAWPLFVRVLVYHFTMGYQSMRELVTGLRHLTVTGNSQITSCGCCACLASAPSINHITNVHAL